MLLRSLSHERIKNTAVNASEVKKQSEIAGIEVVGEAELSISNVKTEPLNIKEGEYFI